MSVWNDNEAVLVAISGSTSMAQILKKLGVHSNSSQYAILRQWASEHGVVLPKYGQTSRTAPLRLDVAQIFSNRGVVVSGKTLARHMTRSFSIPYECSNPACSVGKLWLGLDITLHVDHIDGNKVNNELSNLRFLCPNCHTQTETYAGRRLKKVVLCSCGNKKDKVSKNCRVCTDRARPTLSKYPPLDRVLSCVRKHRGLRKAAEELGVSHTALRQHLIRNNIDTRTLQPMTDMV